MVLAMAISVVAIGVFTLGASAFGPHNVGSFELDGNAFDGLAAGEDWSNVCPTSTPHGISPFCSGDDTANASTFKTDPLGQTIFTTGGSKDDLDVPNWQYTAGSVPDKDELMHAYAAQYTGSDSHVYLYFGADRFAANGDAQIGFWFFQGPVQLSGSESGAGSFVDKDGDPAVHQDGDVLVLSDFTKGGGKPTIRVFEWNGPGGDIAGSGAINGTLDAIGGSGTSAADCLTAGANQHFCATVNAGLVDSPWEFQDKSGKHANQFGPGEFYEGGVDLTFLDLGDECFSSYMAETRSSQSVDATLKDFVLDGFGVCGSTTSTQVSATSVESGDPVTDTATVTGTGSGGGNPPDPTGSVDFFLCGPAADAASADCSTPTDPAFDTQDLDGVSNPSEVTSDSVSPTVPGFYCFHAVYSGDDNYPSSEDGGANECFEVTGVTSMTTDQFVYPNDTATVSTASGVLDGSVTFKLYPTLADCQADPPTNELYSETVALTEGDDSETVSTDNTDTPVSADATVVWTVTYGSDSTHQGRVSECAEKTAIDFTDDASGGSAP
jgi:hypothetical protein